jgi:putative ABC transport system permease protein
MRAFRENSLRYRAKPYFKYLMNLFRNPAAYPFFDRYWKLVSSMEQDRDVTIDRMEYCHNKFGTLNYAAANLFVSHGFDSTYRISLSAGRFFEKAQSGDSASCVINETMARLLGDGDMLGKILVQMTGKQELKFNFKIIGIIRDFNFETLDNAVMPMVMILMPGNFEGYLTVRLKPGDPEPVIQSIRSVWEEYTTAYPFVSFFLNENLESRYQNVRETAKIFSVLSLVSILIACLGLFGLTSYAYNQRSREIGIRKAMGADTSNIILYEIKEVVFLLLIASILAWTGVYWLVNSWLRDYAFKIDLNALYFLIPFITVLFISIITIYYQTHVAAFSSPGKALKYE